MPESTAPASKPEEIRSTARLMRLDPGLYCVSPLPGAPCPDPVTGLPGVRISTAPSDGGHVALCGFGPEGWIGRDDDAMLVRVVGAPAQVLVTVYQSAAGLQESPKLQVLRLSGPTSPAAIEPQPPAEAIAHVYGIGDIRGRVGEWIGERGSQRWIEGFSLQPQMLATAADLEYQAVLGRGWMSPWSEAGQFCGSRGMSLPILGLSVRLRGETAKTHRLVVSATFVDGASAGPMGDGEACEAPTLAALEAFEVVLEKLPARPTRKRR